MIYGNCMWTICISHIRLKDEDDSLVWSKNKLLGDYIACLGYIAMFSFEAWEG
jgi:hypothetical protein